VLYWETNDEKILREQFRQYEQALNMLATALEELERIPGESVHSLADRIEAVFNKLNRKKHKYE
jgi:hypothetical protein